MIDTIVVPLDGSLDAERALPAAAGLAAGWAAELILVRCGWDPDGTTEKSYLADLTARLEQTGATSVRTRVGRGFPEQPIIDLVNEKPETTALCMTTRKHSGLDVALLGTVTETLLRELHQPIVLVGPKCRTADVKIGGGHLIFCFDGSPRSASAAPMVTEWAHQLDLEVHVAMVLHHDGEYLGDHLAAEDRATARELTAQLGDAGVRASLELLDGLDPAHAIDRFALALPAALVATATHSASGVIGTALGRIATRIARHSPCPVLVRPVPRTE